MKHINLTLNGVFAVFDMHGLGIHIQGAKEVVKELLILYAKWYAGADIPVTYDHAMYKQERRWAKKK